MSEYKIIETDNFDREYVPEVELNLPPLTEEQATIICDTLTETLCSASSDKWYRVVEQGYSLNPGLCP